MKWLLWFHRSSSNSEGRLDCDDDSDHDPTVETLPTVSSDSEEDAQPPSKKPRFTNV